MEQMIQELDLSCIANRLITKKKWGKKRVEEAIQSYKNFLILLYKYPKTPLVPTEEIDEVWHDHILHTQKYMEDCSRIFGKYIHHFPFDGKEASQIKIKKNLARTSKLYRKHFNEFYELTPLRASDF